MNNCPDRRGQAVQVGAIVTLGFVVLAISIFQAQGVPQETVETEVEHNQEIADQLETLNVALAETTDSGAPQTTTLRLGTTYDNRPFFVYPPPTAGSLATTEPETVAIENATATGDSEEFENYWNNETRNYTTSNIRYEIDYRELRDTPNFTFEYGLIAAEFENSTPVQRHGTPLFTDTDAGGDISLVVYDGELAEQSPTTESVVVERVTNETTVDIEGDGDDPIRLNLSTELDRETWNETLPSVEESSIESLSNESGTVSIELNSTENYKLTVHKVDVGSNATKPEPTYLRKYDNEDGDEVVDVRDAYNDPVDETVGAWVFDESEWQDSEHTLRIPSEGFKVEDIDGDCLSITDNAETAESYENQEIDGVCP